MGVYVNGSFVMGDFQAASSDIDFLVITRDELRRPDLQRVGAMHRRLTSANVWGARLEGEYVWHRRVRSAGANGPAIVVRSGHASFAKFRTPLTAENVRAFRHDSLTLIGPPARRLLPHVPLEAVRRALNTYLAELLQRKVRRELVKLPPRAAVEAIASWTLNVAGCLYGRRSGHPCTKTVAARWLSRRCPMLKDILAAALAMRRGTATAADRRQLRDAVREVRCSARHLVSSR